METKKFYEYFQMGAYRELDIYVGGEPRKTILQSGFYREISYSSVMHKHCYEEIHVFHGGEATVMLGKDRLKMTSGDIILLPRQMPHNIIDYSDTVVHCAFQIELPGAESGVVNLSERLTECFFERLREIGNPECDHSSLIGFISFFAEQFITPKEVIPSRATDYAFFIHEFFSMSYADDVHISDLARILRVSEKQAERLVVKHTGRTFVEELTTARMQMAEQLMALEPRIPLTTIASDVGYQSYSGFWKAYKRFKERDQ